jgi:sulfate permease, SulP family
LLATLAAYAVFGTSRHLIAAATSAAAVLLASSVGGLAGTDAARYMSDAAGLVIFCGGLFLIAGLLRLGFVAQFLSRPVMEGFVFGLAIFVTVSQLPKLFGIEKGSGDTIKQFIHLTGHLGTRAGRRWRSGPARSCSCSRPSGRRRRSRAGCWRSCWGSSSAPPSARPRTG